MGEGGNNYTPSELDIKNMRVEDLVNEYQLITEKKSSLSRIKRDLIVQRIDKLLREGKIQFKEV
jgi:hypothetical protein